MLKKTDSKKTKQTQLLKLGSDSFKHRSLSEEEMLIRRIDHFTLKNDPFAEIIKSQPKLHKVKGEASYVDDAIRQAFKSQSPPTKVWSRIENREDFILEARKRFDKVRSRCESFQKLPIQQFNENSLNLEDHYQRAVTWIEKNKLSDFKATALYQFSQLLPAMINPEEMKAISKLRVERLKKILVSIETLNDLGVLAEDSPIANRSLWGEARIHIVHQISTAKAIGKYQGFQPQMIRFSKFLKEVKSYGNNSIVYDLFDGYNILQSLYSEHYENYKVHSDRKSKIKDRISDEIGRMSKVKALNTLLEYR